MQISCNICPTCQSECIEIHCSTLALEVNDTFIKSKKHGEQKLSTEVIGNCYSTPNELVPISKLKKPFIDTTLRIWKGTHFTHTPYQNCMLYRHFS